MPGPFHNTDINPIQSGEADVTFNGTSDAKKTVAVVFNNPYSGADPLVVASCETAGYLACPTTVSATGFTLTVQPTTQSQFGEVDVTLGAADTHKTADVTFDTSFTLDDVVVTATCETSNYVATITAVSKTGFTVDVSHGDLAAPGGGGVTVAVNWAANSAVAPAATVTSNWIAIGT